MLIDVVPAWREGRGLDTVSESGNIKLLGMKKWNMHGMADRRR